MEQDATAPRHAMAAEDALQQATEDTPLAKKFRVDVTDIPPAR
jgi:hypothetical protein